MIVSGQADARFCSFSAIAACFRPTALLDFAAVGQRTSSRRASILEALGRAGFVEVARLKEELGCSEATVRRDLEYLQRAGYLQRTHGGAIVDGDRELPFPTKAQTMVAEKERIAEAAVALAGDARAIGLTGGTTTQQIARRLAQRTGLTIVTNAINIAMEFADTDNRVIVTGGELRGRTFELVGPLAEPVASQINLDLIFVGVDGVSPEGGLTTHHPIEARTNRVLIERAAKTVVVTDHLKLGRRTFAQIAPLELADVVVTDSGADPRVTAELERAGAAVVLA
jgi:DeoR family transcriptional regulator of aga operon